MVSTNEENSNQDNCTYLNREIENMELAYSYSQMYLTDRAKVIESLNIRLTTLLGFSGLLLRFCLDLPDGCSITVFTKVSAIVCSALAVFMACYGLVARPKGSVMKPEELIETFFEEEAIVLKTRIYRTLYETAQDVRLSSKIKSTRLNVTIFMAILTVVGFGISGIVATFNSSCV